MRRFWIVPVTLACLVSLATAADPVADEKEVSSRVTSVSLFKNGLAVVRREVDIAGPGVYRLSDVIEPVHGTFMVESAGTLVARIEARDIKGDENTALGINLQEELAGLNVTVYGRNNKAPVTGQVVPPPKKNDAESPPLHEYNPYYRPAAVTEQPSRFLILKTAKGMSYVELNDIASLESEGNAIPRTIKKPVLLLEAGEGARPGKIAVSYLAHGLSWAPSYRVDVSDPKKLTIEQHAVVRNELSELSDSEVNLISGYPSVQFANVVSPLAANQSWQRFFQQASRPSEFQAVAGITMQNAVYSQSGRGGAPDAGGPAVAPNLGDTIDLNFHSIGKRSLKKGAALALATGKAEAEYERIVDWLIPDTRDEWGHSRDPRGRHVDPNTGDPLQDDVWDALKFKNPLPFPMTTAPAMVVNNGKFNGQRQVLWTNRGESATLRVNKALSMRTRCVEFEEQKGQGASEREIIYIGGRRFRQATVNGELRLCNHRGADVKMLIKRHFSGDLVKADGDPKIELREEGIWTANKRNELVWTFTLKPGEERNLAYQYKVLVNF